MLFTQSWKKKNLKVYGINNRAIDRSSKDIFPDFDSLPEKVDAAIINVSPKYVLDVVKDAYKRGIRKIWLQQGAESIEAIQYCNERDINVIHDRCVLMFSNPEEFPHNFHRWVLKIFGKLPKNVN